MLVWLIAAVFGLLAATFGAVLLIPTLRFAIAASGSAQGTVIGHDCEQSEATTYYYPRVSFTTGDHEWVIRGQCGTVRPVRVVGAQVRGYFPPSDPASAEFSRGRDAWFAAGLLTTGTGVTLASVWELLAPTASAIAIG